jgi:hypothetical protein
VPAVCTAGVVDCREFAFSRFSFAVDFELPSQIGFAFDLGNPPPMSMTRWLSPSASKLGVATVPVGDVIDVAEATAAKASRATAAASIAKKDLSFIVFPL